MPKSIYCAVARKHFLLVRDILAPDNNVIDYVYSPSGNCSFSIPFVVGRLEYSLCVTIRSQLAHINLILYSRLDEDLDDIIDEWNKENVLREIMVHKKTPVIPNKRLGVGPNLTTQFEVTYKETALKNGAIFLVKCLDSDLQKEMHNILSDAIIKLSLSDAIPANVYRGNLTNNFSRSGLKNAHVIYLQKQQTNQREYDLNLSDNYLQEFVISKLTYNVSLLNLADNLFTEFPYSPSLTVSTLYLQHNYLKSLPPKIGQQMPNLTWLDVSHNLLEDIPDDLVSLRSLFVSQNPLSKILPPYRNDEKILEYLHMVAGKDKVPWSQVKLMLVGHEGVGKTTLLKKLQDRKYQCTDNLSTNGVDIGSLTLPCSTSLLSRFSSENVQFQVWDFGGQTVFHSTHRFFITSNAIYVILYNMTKYETISLVKYWIDQVGSLHDPEKSKPILIVGTHADQLSKQERKQVIAQVQQMYPVATLKNSRNQICGHFTISTTSGMNIEELQEKLVDVAKNHPKVGQIKVPRYLEKMRSGLQEIKSKLYMRWDDYEQFASNFFLDSLQEVTAMLHNTGAVVWHNVPKLRDLVIINPQWLADAMASVVTFMILRSAAQDGGLVDWLTLRKSMKLKFPNEDTHGIIVSLLEYFEIIYKLRMNKPKGNALDDRQQFFVPSLLLEWHEGTPHPSIQYWQQIQASHIFSRHIKWNFYPSGFFPRLLLRLVHLRLRLRGAWLNAAVVMGRDGSECAFLKLVYKEESHILQVTIKKDGESQANKEPLIAELSYAIVRLHRDMYTHTPVVHEVIITDQSNSKEIAISLQACIQEQTRGNAYMDVEGIQVKIDDEVPDLLACPLIHSQSLRVEKELGQGAFGVVLKAKMHQNSRVIDVALKEMLVKDDMDSIYDFQHEMTIMSKLNHENLVKLYGVTKTLQMVLEFVPCGDLHHLLKANHNVLTEKWKLKFAIDCACGMLYLHSQVPPICHSDLRTPNIFVMSLDEEADVIGKIADFGLSQQVFPHLTRELQNITETAPETWGETRSYDEKSDIYSFAVVLWNLFGSKFQYKDQLPNNNTAAVQEDQNEEFAFLHVHGKHTVPKKQQQAIIKNGGRLPIFEKCPAFWADLISSCWKTDPDSRPAFTTVLECLMSFYIQTYSEDEYILQKKNSVPLGANSNTPEEAIYFQDCNVVSSGLSSWKSINFTERTTVTSIAEIGTEIWLGTKNFCLFILHTQTCKVIQKNEFQQPEVAGARGIKILSIDTSCVWVAVGTHVHIFSAKLRQEIACRLCNNNPIIQMVLIPESMVVWMADSANYITIWDTKTLQICQRFQIHQSYCAQEMALMDEFVWMAVGRDVIPVHTTTTEIQEPTPAHDDRITAICAVPQTHQVWTSARDGTVRVWKMSQKHIPELIFEWKTESVPIICVMADGVHVCVGTVGDTATVWNVQTFQQEEIKMPPDYSHKHGIQCMLGTHDFLWCGIERTTHALMCYPHSGQTNYNLDGIILA